MAFTKSIPVRTVGFVLMFLAWAFASNRCAFAALVSPSTKSAEAHQCCASRLAPSVPTPPAKRTCECCQELGALPVKSDDGLVNAPVFEPLAAAVVSELALPKASTIMTPAVPATGPPEARSFVELVVQRSLRGLAPPRLG